MRNIKDQLRAAAKSGSAEKIGRLLTLADCDPLVRDDDGGTVLMRAAANEHEACVKLLLPVSDPLAVAKIVNQRVKSL